MLFQYSSSHLRNEEQFELLNAPKRKTYALQNDVARECGVIVSLKLVFYASVISSLLSAGENMYCKE